MGPAKTKMSSLEQEWDKIDGPQARKVTAVVVGCGNRGQNYAQFAREFPSRLEVRLSFLFVSIRCV